jgi:hypothetical protein
LAADARENIGELWADPLVVEPDWKLWTWTLVRAKKFASPALLAWWKQYPRGAACKTRTPKQDTSKPVVAMDGPTRLATDGEANPEQYQVVASEWLEAASPEADAEADAEIADLEADWQAEQEKRYRREMYEEYRRGGLDMEVAKAEEACNGVLLNHLGQQEFYGYHGKHAGKHISYLWQCNWVTAKKYASEELLRYWEEHPRYTKAAILGDDYTRWAQSKNCQNWG